MSATDDVAGERLDDDFFAIVNRPVFMTVLLFGLALATSRLEMSVASGSMTLARPKSRTRGLPWASMTPARL